MALLRDEAFDGHVRRLQIVQVVGLNFSKKHLAGDVVRKTIQLLAHLSDRFKEPSVLTFGNGNGIKRLRVDLGAASIDEIAKRTGEKGGNVRSPKDSENEAADGDQWNHQRARAAAHHAGHDAENEKGDNQTANDPFGDEA